MQDAEYAVVPIARPQVGCVDKGATTIVRMCECPRFQKAALLSVYKEMFQCFRNASGARFQKKSIAFTPFLCKREFETHQNVAIFIWKHHVNGA